MGAEYPHAVTVKQQNTIGGAFVLPAGVPQVVEAWRLNPRAAQQVAFRVFLDNNGINPISSVTVRGSNVAGGGQPYSDTVLLPIFPGDRGWFEFPGPCPEYWQLEATSAAGTTCSWGWSEVFIVQS
jgi:hypothetical protein